MVTIIGFVNPKAGMFCRRKEHECKDLAARFAQTARAEIRMARSAESIDDDIREAFLAADVLAIIGGDGSTGRAYNAVAGMAQAFPHKVIASVPAGSGCAVRYEFGTGEDLMGEGFRIRRLSENLEQHAEWIDLIGVNRTDLAMFASVGVSTSLIGFYEKSIWRGRNAAMGYLCAGAQQALPLAAKKPLTLHEHRDDGCTTERAAMLMVTKFKHIGKGYAFNPEAEHADGLLHCRSYGKMDALRSLYAAQRGNPAGNYFTASRLELAADAPFPYEINGDVQQPTNHVVFEVVPRAVRVLNELV